MKSLEQWLVDKEQNFLKDRQVRDASFISLYETSTLETFSDQHQEILKNLYFFISRDEIREHYNSKRQGKHGSTEGSEVEKT